MAVQWFIDESKQNGLTMVVVSVDATHIGSVRARISTLPRRRGSALHFTKESNATRASALREIASLPLSAFIIQVPKAVRPILARERAIRKIASEAKIMRPTRIVFERDAAVELNDRRWLRDELIRTNIEYLHLGKNGDPLLWIADAIAWADNRGGDWLKMIAQLITKRMTA